MNKAIGTLIAAVSALALSAGAYAQTAGGGGGAANGGSSHGSTASPAANQMNDTSSGYGMPGATNSDSGMSAGSANSSMQKGMNDNSTSTTAAPKTNNTLATPSVVSPAK